MTPVDRRRSRSRSLRSRSPSRRAPARARSRSPPSRSPRALFGARAAVTALARRPSRSTRLLARWRRPWRPTAPPVAACDAATPPSRERPRHRPPRRASPNDSTETQSARATRAPPCTSTSRVRRAVVCRRRRRVCESFAVVKPPRTPFIFSVIGRPSTSSDQSSDRSRHTATTRRGASIDLDRRESRGNVRARVESSRRAWRTRGEARRWPRGDNRSRLVAIGRYVKTRRRRREGGRARAFATSLEVNTRIDSFERARETRARGSRSGLR